MNNLIAKLSNQIGNLFVTNALLQTENEDLKSQLNDQKLKHPEDFPADNDSKKQKGENNG